MARVTQLGEHDGGTEEVGILGTVVVHGVHAAEREVEVRLATYSSTRPSVPSRTATTRPAAAVARPMRPATTTCTATATRKNA